MSDFHAIQGTINDRTNTNAPYSNIGEKKDMIRLRYGCLGRGPGRRHGSRAVGGLEAHVIERRQGLGGVMEIIQLNFIKG